MIVNEKMTGNEAVEQKKNYSGGAFDSDRKESGKEKYGRNELKTGNHDKHGVVVREVDFKVADQRRKIAADNSHDEQSVSDCLKIAVFKSGAILPGNLSTKKQA